ncbi:radical SAM protein [Thermococcus sp. LS2]
MCSRALLTLTHRCNFQCKHCLQGNNKWSPQIKELTAKEWMNIIDQLSEYGASYLFFTGGEPFLRRDTLQLLQYAGEYAFPLRVYTNATLLTPEIIKKYLKLIILLSKSHYMALASRMLIPLLVFLAHIKNYYLNQNINR